MPCYIIWKWKCLAKCSLNCHRLRFSRRPTSRSRRWTTQRRQGPGDSSSGGRSHSWRARHQVISLHTLQFLTASKMRVRRVSSRLRGRKRRAFQLELLNGLDFSLECGHWSWIFKLSESNRWCGAWRPLEVFDHHGGTLRNRMLSSRMLRCIFYKRHSVGIIELLVGLEVTIIAHEYFELIQLAMLLGNLLILPHIDLHSTFIVTYFLDSAIFLKWMLCSGRLSKKLAVRLFLKYLNSFLVIWAHRSM